MVAGHTYPHLADLYKAARRVSEQTEDEVLSLLLLLPSPHDGTGTTVAVELCALVEAVSLPSQTIQVQSFLKLRLPLQPPEGADIGCRENGSSASAPMVKSLAALTRQVDISATLTYTPPAVLARDPRAPPPSASLSSRPYFTTLPPPLLLYQLQWRDGKKTCEQEQKQMKVIQRYCFAAATNQPEEGVHAGADVYLCTHVHLQGIYYNIPVRLRAFQDGDSTKQQQQQHQHHTTSKDASTLYYVSPSPLLPPSSGSRDVCMSYRRIRQDEQKRIIHEAFGHALAVALPHLSSSPAAVATAAAGQQRSGCHYCMYLNVRPSSPPPSNRNRQSSFSFLFDDAMVPSLGYAALSGLQHEVYRFHTSQLTLSSSLPREPPPPPQQQQHQAREEALATLRRKTGREVAVEKLLSLFYPSLTLLEKLQQPPPARSEVARLTEDVLQEVVAATTEADTNSCKKNKEESSDPLMLLLLWKAKFLRELQGRRVGPSARRRDLLPPPPMPLHLFAEEEKAPHHAHFRRWVPLPADGAAYALVAELLQAHLPASVPLVVALSRAAVLPLLCSGVEEQMRGRRVLRGLLTTAARQLAFPATRQQQQQQPPISLPRSTSPTKERERQQRPPPLLTRAEAAATAAAPPRTGKEVKDVQRPASCAPIVAIVIPQSQLRFAGQQEVKAARPPPLPQVPASSAALRARYVAYQLAQAMQDSAGAAAAGPRRTPVMAVAPKPEPVRCSGDPRRDVQRMREVLDVGERGGAGPLGYVTRSFYAPHTWFPPEAAASPTALKREGVNVLDLAAAAKVQWDAKFIVVALDRAKRPRPPGDDDEEEEEEAAFSDALRHYAARRPQQHRHDDQLQRKGSDDAEEDTAAAATLEERHERSLQRYLQEKQWFVLDQHAIHERLRLEFFLMFAEAYVMHPELDLKDQNNNNKNNNMDANRVERGEGEVLCARLEKVRVLLSDLDLCCASCRQEETKKEPQRKCHVDKPSAHVRELDRENSDSLSFPALLPSDLRQRVTALEGSLQRCGWRFHHEPEPLSPLSSREEEQEVSVLCCAAVRQWPLLKVEGFSLELDSLQDLRCMVEELEVAGAAPPSKHRNENCETGAVSISSPSVIIPSAILQFLISRSCRGAIMFGDVLSAAAVRRLLEELQAVEQFYVCSHGRPSFAVLQPRQMNKMS